MDVKKLRESALEARKWKEFEVPPETKKDEKTTWANDKYEFDRFNAKWMADVMKRKPYLKVWQLNFIDTETFRTSTLWMMKRRANHFGYHFSVSHMEDVINCLKCLGLKVAKRKAKFHARTYFAVTAKKPG